MLEYYQSPTLATTPQLLLAGKVYYSSISNCKVFPDFTLIFFSYNYCTLWVCRIWIQSVKVSAISIVRGILYRSSQYIHRRGAWRGHFYARHYATATAGCDYYSNISKEENFLNFTLILFITESTTVKSSTSITFPTIIFRVYLRVCKIWSQSVRISADIPLFICIFYKSSQ